MSGEELAEVVHLQSHFIEQDPEDESVFEEIVEEGKTEYGEVLKQIF